MSGRSRGSIVLLCLAGLILSMALPATAMAKAPTAVGIGFDDVSAPCFFEDTVALHAEYSGKGILFLGPAKHDGGGILNECGIFGVSGYSPPNFLAFNTGANYSDGGFPRPPELIVFKTTVSHVGVLVGSGISTGTVTMKAYDSSHHLLGTKTVALQPQMHSLTLSASGIAAVRIDSTGSTWVLDDLVAA